MKQSRGYSQMSVVFEALEERLLLSVLPLPTFELVDFAESAVCLPADVFSDYVRPEDSVISSDLQQIKQAVAHTLAENPLTDLSQLSTPFLLVNRGGDIHVYVHVDEVNESITQTLQNAGLYVENSNQGMRVVQGWLNYTLLDSLADIDGVRRIAPPVYAVTNTGGITTAGDGILNADDLRSVMNVTGSGVRIGVISDGLDHWANVDDTGDLPAYDTGITVHSTFSGKGDEGTAILEIVYDLAPDSDLYFAGFRSDGSFSSTDMVTAIEWMVNQGVDVIVDDLSFFAQPMFEDGTDTVADAAADAVSSGVVYATSAGNYAELHYQADYISSAGGYHDFDSGAGVDQVLMFDGVAQGWIHGALQWSDEWGSSGNDYDLHLVGWNGSGWDNLDAYVTGGRSEQDGDDNPAEIAHYYNTSYGTVAWAFKKIGGSDRELEFITYGGLLEQNEYEDDYVASDSIFGHAAVESVISVGAIDASDLGNDDVEPFSSRGPSTIYTDFVNQTSTTRNTLDVCGIDGVSTKAGDLGYFSDPFYGTSAAAPHIAAIAGLLLEIDPTLTPAQVQDLINDNAVDILTSGYDDISGYGRADALATVTAAATAVDLKPGDDGDTGESTTDKITMLDNSAAGKKLKFYVEGTIQDATVKLYGPGDVVIGTGTGNGGTLTITTNGTVDLTDGANGIYATQTVTGKLESAATTSLSVTVDTVAPTVSVPDLYVNDDSGSSSTDNITQGSTPQFDGTASDANSGLWKVDVISNDSKSGSDSSTPATYSVELATLDEMASLGRTVTATAYDVAGNSTQSSALGLTIDRTAPTVTVTSLATADRTPALTGAVNDSQATIGVTVDGNGYSATNNGNDTWTLADDTITPALIAGTYNVAVTATDVAGNVGNDTTSNELTIYSTIADRYLFYNNSIFDDPGEGFDDDDAIAPDKEALLPGESSDFANQSGSAEGINGIMVDIYGLAGTLTADDFIFRVSEDGDPSDDEYPDPADWSSALAPDSITVRSGEGVGGSDRIVIIWDDNDIQEQWLQITVLATGDTGLEEDDVFYFGHILGDANGDGVVSAGDFASVQANFGNYRDPEEDDPYDLPGDANGDWVVSAGDFASIQANFGDVLVLDLS